jgi:hypothetical protein
MFSRSDNSSSTIVESKVSAYWHVEFRDGIIYGTNLYFERKTLFQNCRNAQSYVIFSYFVNNAPCRNYFDEYGRS